MPKTLNLTYTIPNDHIPIIWHRVFTNILPNKPCEREFLEFILTNKGKTWKPGTYADRFAFENSKAEANYFSQGYNFLKNNNQFNLLGKIIQAIQNPEIKFQATLLGGEKDHIGEGLWEESRTCFAKGQFNEVCKEFVQKNKRIFWIQLYFPNGGKGRVLVLFAGDGKLYFTNFYHPYKLLTSGTQREKNYFSLIPQNDFYLFLASSFFGETRVAKSTVITTYLPIYLNKDMHCVKLTKPNAKRYPLSQSEIKMVCNCGKRRNVDSIYLHTTGNNANHLGCIRCSIPCPFCGNYYITSNLHPLNCAKKIINNVCPQCMEIEGMLCKDCLKYISRSFYTAHKDICKGKIE